LGNASENHPLGRHIPPCDGLPNHYLWAFVCAPGMPCPTVGYVAERLAETMPPHGALRPRSEAPCLPPVGPNALAPHYPCLSTAHQEPPVASTGNAIPLLPTHRGHCHASGHNCDAAADRPAPPFADTTATQPGKARAQSFSHRSAARTRIATPGQPIPPLVPAGTSRASVGQSASQPSTRSAMLQNARRGRHAALSPADPQLHLPAVAAPAGIPGDPRTPKSLCS
jgi:hypothetical protein